MSTAIPDAFLAQLAATGITGSTVTVNGTSLTVDDLATVQAALNSFRDNGLVNRLILTGQHAFSGSLRLCGGIGQAGGLVVTATGASVRNLATAANMVINSYPGEDFPGYTGRGNIVVDGGTWDHNGYNGTDGTQTGINDVFAFGHARAIVLRNATILNTNAGHAAEANSCDGWIFQDLTINGFTNASGNSGRDTSEAIQIDSATAGGWVVKPTDNTPCHNGTVRRVTFGTTSRAGAFGRYVGSHAYTPGNDYVDIDVSACSGSGFTDVAIGAFHWIGDSSVTGNTFTGGIAGVEVEYSPGLTISGNTLTNASLAQVHVTNASTAVRITGNTFSSTVVGALGILVDDGVIGVIIDANVSSLLNSIPAVRVGMTTGVTPSVTGGWSARLRTADLHLTDPVIFSSLTLVENYNAPDMLTLTASADALKLATDATGIVVNDEAGNQRFAGVMYGPREFDSDGTGTVAYASDLVWLWRRIIYSDPTHTWFDQTLIAYDIANNTAEERILYYLYRDAAAGAAAIGRGVPFIRIPTGPPTGTGRGPTAQTTARFDTLGALVASLAESGGMRIRMKQTYAAGDSRHLDVTLDDAPDLSSWARYGTPEASGPGLLADGWHFAITAPTTNCVLLAAGGELENRITHEVRDDVSIALWGRIEQFLDARQTTDPAEIIAAGNDALKAGGAVAEIVAQISDGDGMRIGVDIPIGSKVSCVLNGQTFVDRVRSLTTTVAGGQAPTVTTVPVFGSPDVPIPITSAQLAAMQRRISSLERNK